MCGCVLQIHLNTEYVLEECWEVTRACLDVLVHRRTMTDYDRGGTIQLIKPVDLVGTSLYLNLKNENKKKHQTVK